MYENGKCFNCGNKTEEYRNVCDACVEKDKKEDEFDD